MTMQDLSREAQDAARIEDLEDEVTRQEMLVQAFTELWKNAQAEVERLRQPIHRELTFRCPGCGLEGTVTLDVTASEEEES